MLPNTPEYLATVRAARMKANGICPHGTYRISDDLRGIVCTSCEASRHRTTVKCDPMALVPMLFGAGSVFAMFAYLGWMWFKELSA